MSTPYVRQSVERLIIEALQSLGGSATKREIKEEIVSNEANEITHENVFEPIVSKKGTRYVPFNFDFNFGLKNLHTCGYIEDYARFGDVMLTEKGRMATATEYPSSEEQLQIDRYWAEKNKARLALKANQQAYNTEEKEDSVENTLALDITSEDDSSDDWRVSVLEQIKQFSPKKFESFSRLLLSQMGVKSDRDKGVQLSGDRGIDGYGYFESDEFRTVKVVIQCKRYTDISVSEPEIDKLKGVMMSFNADYGIFITTSVFTKKAKEKALQGGNTVTLIDGQRLVDLIEKYQLHITPVLTYRLNDYYFEKD